MAGIAEMAERLTDRLVKALPVPASGSRTTHDGEMAGFGVRVTAAGARAFILRYRVGGRERLITIGSFPDWTTTAARDEAKALKRRVDRGEDPMAERHAEREAPTMDDLCERYAADELPKKRPLSQRDFRAIINTIIRPKLGRRKVADINFGDIERLHRDVSSHAPVRANRVASLLRTLFNLAIKWGYRGDNPCKGIEWNPEDRRERYLSPAELAALSAALVEHRDQRSADVIRLLALTGARRGEALSATWDQFDFATSTWVKPSAHTKQKRIHRAPLSAPAVELLTSIRQRQRDGERFVFPGDVPGQPLTDVKKSWAAVCKRAGIEGARLHDLRHTFASILVSGGGSLPLIGAMLGHTQVSTTARYAHLADDPLRAAAERVGAVYKAAQIARPAEVVPLQGKR
jgi:integrase